jgi:catechol 2,3-dioxygenase-like lactoylglutathione lyase family enzyme
LPILNMNHTGIKVKDLKKAFHFYNKVLNIPKVQVIGPEDNPEYVFLQGLELKQKRLEDGEVSFTHVGFEVSNIEEVYEELKKNVVFKGPIKDKKFVKEKKAVKFASFTDPDGNIVEIVEWRNL